MSAVDVVGTDEFWSMKNSADPVEQFISEDGDQGLKQHLSGKERRKRCYLLRSGDRATHGIPSPRRRGNAPKRYAMQRKDKIRVACRDLEAQLSEVAHTVYLPVPAQLVAM